MRKRLLLVVVSSLLLVTGCDNTTLSTSTGSTPPQEIVFVEHHGPVDLSQFRCHRTTDSSFVRRICEHDFTYRHYLVVQLNEQHYHYCDVPMYTLQWWLQADSKGEFYNRSVRGRDEYDCRYGYVPVTLPHQAQPRDW